MNFCTKKSYGAWIGLIMGAVLFTFSFWGIGFSLGEGDKVLQLLLYIPAYIFLAIYIYLLIGSFSMEYSIDKYGVLIHWGVRKIRIPWSEINEVIYVKGSSNLFSMLGASWPGYMAGLYNAKGLGPVRMYATHYEEGFIYLKTNKGFFGITPEDGNMINIIAENAAKEITTVDMETMPEEIKGENIREDNLYQILYRINIIFLAAFALYIAIFFPGSGAPNFIILLLVLAVALFLFSLSNAARLYQFSSAGGYMLLTIGIAVTGIFFILSLFEITL
ncbi:MAG: PH domain-containing protein [Syntrophomonadaceae bacterium]|nr:PH domain-containing protein [Syntrophomonadaceae bacterium]